MNITPIVLAITGLVSLNQEFNFTLLVFTLTLLGDSYCALRFKQGSDKIKYSPIEQFARESWTQSAFQKQGNLTLQIVACVFIFS